MTNTLQVAKSGDQDLVMARTFDAPRPLVFDAFTKPELVRRWLLGPPGWNDAVCEIDLKVAGRYRMSAEQRAGARTWGSAALIARRAAGEDRS